MDQDVHPDDLKRARTGHTPLSGHKDKAAREGGQSTQALMAMDPAQTLTVGVMQQLLDNQTNKMQTQFDTMMGQLRLQMSTEIAE
eukprot:2514525-Karenia_brevis.AAC.1